MNSPTSSVFKSLEVVAPPPELTVSEWADEYRVLSQGASSEPGRWVTDRAPYQRGIMNSINEEDVHTVVVKSSAQIGKTEFLLNIIGYFIDYDPSPIMVIQPQLELAESFSKDRLAPMLKDTKALNGKVKDSKSRNTGNTILHKKFPGGHITLAGANSPSSLASRPVRIVLCDEVDRYPLSAGTEGDPVKLIQKRSKTFYNKISVLLSTPTTEAQSRIEQSYKQSDRRQYHVPCPLCKRKQVLIFDRFKWEKDQNGQPQNVRYECEHCGKSFDDSHKDWMLLNGEWHATGHFRGIAGFHIWEAYSPWVSWNEIVTEFLDSKDNPEALKTFVNTSLGECWKEKGDAPDWKRLYDNREDFQIGTVPKGGIFLTAGVDVQKDRIEYEVVAWGRDKENWSVDYGVILGNTLTDKPWGELDKVINGQYPNHKGLMIPISKIAIDSGYNTQRVYNFCRKYPITRVLAVKGVDNSQLLVGQPSIIDVNHMGKRVKRGYRVWPIGVNMIKTELYGWLKIPSPTDQQEYSPCYCHFPMYSEEYFKQLTAEQLVKKRVRGYTRFIWEKLRNRNEALDCRVYNRAAAAVFGIDRLTEKNWKNLEARLGVVASPSKKPSRRESKRPGGSFWEDGRKSVWD